MDLPLPFLRVRPTDPRVGALREALHDLDPLADRLAQWVQESPANRGTFTRAVERGLGSVDSPPEPLAAFFAHVDHTPDWLDRDAVRLGVTFIEATWAPGQQAAWLLVPADYSLLNRETTARLVARWKEIAPDANRTPSPCQTERESASILIPTCNGRRGHPILLGWHWAAGVAALPEDQGLNALIRAAGTAVAEFPCDDAGVLVDLDTPGDYEQARKQIEQMRTQVPG